MTLDFDALAAELMRALRGKRSQRAFSRRLGMKSNTAYSWEAGRRWPTATRFFHIASRTGRDLPAAVAHDETGLLYRAGDTAQLVDLLAELAADPTRRARIGRAARGAAVKNSWRSVAEFVLECASQGCDR